MDPASGELESVIAGASGGRIAGLRPGNILTLEAFVTQNPQLAGYAGACHRLPQ
jgi:hypothetical protein